MAIIHKTQPIGYVMVRFETEKCRSGLYFQRLALLLKRTESVDIFPFRLLGSEMGSGSGMKYPTQRIINFGIQVTFNNK